MNRAILAGLGCLTLAAFAIGATLDPVTIKRTPTKGQKIAYAMSGQIDFNGMNVDLASKEVDTILDVAADGNYTTESMQSELTINGSPGPSASAPTKTTVKPSGEIVTIELPPEGQDQSRLAALTQFYFPAMPVNIGDTWSYTGKKDEKLGTVPFKVDLKYTGDDTVGSFSTWKIDVDSKETEGASPTSLHSTVWLDKKDGSMVKVMSKFTNLPAGGMALNGTMNFTRS